MKYLEAQRCLITTQKHLLLGGFISNTCTLITFRYSVLLSNSLRYMFPRVEVSMFISEFEETYFCIYIFYVSFVISYFFWYLFFPYF